MGEFERSGPGSAREISGVAAWIVQRTQADHMRAFDAKTRVRAEALLFTAAVSLVVTIMWFQSLEDAQIPGSLHFNMNETHLRVVMLLLTFVLWAQLAELYYIQIKEEVHAYFVHDSVFWRKHRKLCFAAEFFVLGIHVFPGLGDRVSRHFALFMVLRLYLFFRVLRNRSQLYRSRYELLQNTTLRSLGTVHVSWALVFKVTFLDTPWTTVSIMMLTTILVYSFGIYCYERQPNDVDPVWSIRDALWLVFNTSTTLGLGDLTPRTSGGRVVVAFSVLTGLILASLLVYVVLSSLGMKTNESHARNLMWLARYTERQREAAAALIQHTWRFHAWKSKHEEDLSHRARGGTGRPFSTSSSSSFKGTGVAGRDAASYPVSQPESSRRRKSHRGRRRRRHGDSERNNNSNNNDRYYGGRGDGDSPTASDQDDGRGSYESYRGGDRGHGGDYHRFSKSDGGYNSEEGEDHHHHLQQDDNKRRRREKKQNSTRSKSPPPAATTTDSNAVEDTAIRQEAKRRTVEYKFVADELKARLKRYRRELVEIRMHTARLLAGAGTGDQPVSVMFGSGDGPTPDAITQSSSSLGGRNSALGGVGGGGGGNGVPCHCGRLSRENRDLRRRLVSLESAMEESFRRMALQNREIMIAVTGRDPATDGYGYGDTYGDTYSGTREPAAPSAPSLRRVVGKSRSSSSSASASASASSASSSSDSYSTTW